MGAGFMVGTRQRVSFRGAGDFVRRAVRNGPQAKGCAVAQALRRCRSLLIAAALLSGLINVLALAGSLYTLKIYNRILSSQSEVALVLLTLAMVALYATSGILDFFRAHLLGEVALRFDRALSARIFAYHMNPGSADDQPLRDLDQMRAFLSGPAPAALFDVSVASRLSRRNLPPASPARRLRRGSRGPPARAHARGGAR
jgi:ABC-type protease/lipase transport system fused ATPase/permease subunit